MFTEKRRSFVLNKREKRSKIKDLAMFSFDVKTKQRQSPILMQILKNKSPKMPLKFSKEKDAFLHYSSNQQNKKYQQAGITLIPLIITIVVLLILASITVATLIR